MGYHGLLPDLRFRPPGVFHPDHLMRDLPTTSREQADRCLEAAGRSGLERVKVANELFLE